MEYRLVYVFSALENLPFFRESRIPIKTDDKSHELEILQIYASVDNDFHMEVSSKSPSELGKKLSALNLLITLSTGERVPVECAYQASKVTSKCGGPHLDLLHVPPKEIKKDNRIVNGGEVLGYVLEGVPYAKEFFYDWLYIKALVENGLENKISKFTTFSDIFYYNSTTGNSQAKSCAIAVGLQKAGYVLKTVTQSYSNFIKLIRG